MRRFIFSYLSIVLIISAIHFALVYYVLEQSEENQHKQETAQLKFNTTFLTEQTSKNLQKLISEIMLLALPDKNEMAQTEDVQQLLQRRKEIFHLNYFSADGNLQYASKKVALEWRSNLLNSDWYRSLIKDWQITITNIHKSPVSPFPQVIAIAIPVLVNKSINGFWLVYLDISYIRDIFVTMRDKSKEITSVWFDNNGEIIKLSAADSKITRAYIKSNGWWYKINEANSNNYLSDYKEAKTYLFSTDKNPISNFQILMVRDARNALDLYYNFKSGIILRYVILQLILMIGLAILIWQWQKQKVRLSDLSNVNTLLETKSDALITTNEKLDKLVRELDEQKKQLVAAKNTLERVQKYLNFLTLPVIALDSDFKFEFINRAAEVEFDYTLEKLHSKPLAAYLQINDKETFTKLLKSAQKSMQRQEAPVNIQTSHGIKNFMVSCDYLSFGDWQGFIITFTDLTELLQLQNNIKTQNIFLEKTSNLTEHFLLPHSEDDILNEALNILKQFAGSKAVMYYQNENSRLLLKAFVTDHEIHLPQALPSESIAAGAVVSGQPVIIKSRGQIPENVSPPEKQIDFHKAIFHPVILNNQNAGVIIVLDPDQDIIVDYENTFQKLMIHFKIGLSALVSKTKLQLAKNELEQSAGLRAHLLRSITHGLKTPLSTIKGYVKLIQLKFASFLKEQTEFDNFIQKLDSATEDMNDKIMMYLDMARVNRNDLHFDSKRITVKELIAPVTKALLVQSEMKNIKIDYRDKKLNNVKMTVDARRNRYALKTIFTNAVQYAPEGDSVSLSIWQEQENLLLSFEDHGKAINKKNISMIGLELLPGNVKKERLHYGDSLAMALAVRIIELSGGKLVVSSDKKKTVHTIQLPLN